MKTYKKIVSAIFLLVLNGLVPGVGTVFGAPVPGRDVNYTTDADFDKGTLMNLTYASVHNQLMPSDTTTPFPFVYVANSGRGTIVRIDVNSGVILGEFYTAPTGMSRDPSRTTVDQFGNVWVSNRAESSKLGGVAKGSITRVGLIIGGTRANANGSVNPTGEYLKPPFQYNTCVDRNADGLIKTSRAADDKRPWNNTGSVDTAGGVATAEDECIINYTRVAATNTRTVAVDANNDIWVGGLNTAHEKVSGLTGQPIPGTGFNLGCGGYGGLIDRNGVLWSARYGGLLRYDTKTATGTCLGNANGDYGLALDPNTGEIWHTSYSGNFVAKLAPNGTLLGKYSHGNSMAQGVVVDKSGNVWVAHSTTSTTVGHLRTNGTYIGKISTGSGPTGVAVDANGKVWATNYWANTATRIDPNAGVVNGGFKIGAVDKTVALGTGATPYNYSDMTGFVAIGGTSPQGSWTVVQDSGIAANGWGTITWNREAAGRVPTGALILVEARSADSEAGLSGRSFAAVANNQPFNLNGRYIEVRTTLKPNSSGEKPVLSDLRISMTPINNVRVIDTLSAANIIINENSFVRQPYSITPGIDTTAVEWHFDAFTIGQLQDLSYTVTMKNPVPGESRPISHKLEVLYTDIYGNPVRNELGTHAVNVLSSRYAASVVTDKTIYGARENVFLTAEAKNLSQFARTLDAKVLIEDSAGATVKEVSTATGWQFAAGETKNFGDLVFNTGSTYAGVYRARIVLFEGLNQVGTTTADLTITPEIVLSAHAVTDKISYRPNEQATITANLENRGANYTLENLNATITISRQEATGNLTLYTMTKNVPLLMSGAMTTFKTSWDTGINPAGSYTVALVVRDAAGAVLSTFSGALAIDQATTPTSLLKGQISLDRQSILTGEPVTASYSVTNMGNVDLPAAALSVRTVDMDGQAIYQSIDSQTALAMGARFVQSGVIDTLDYSAKDYLVILTATIDGVEETLAGTYFRVEGAPTVPALIGPAHTSDVQTFTPELIISNAADPNDDRLNYEYELYADSGLTNLAATATIAESAGTTRWLTTPLLENQTYYWRVRAFDGYLYGPWMEMASFRVNTVDEPPTAPQVSSPANGTSVDTLTPLLSVANAADPEGAALTYRFALSTDTDFTQLLATQDGIASGESTTTWSVSEALLENGWYFWRALASDPINSGPWSETARFQVNTANDAPTAPSIVAPSDDSVLTALQTEVVVANSIDPDSPALSYTFEADTAATFDSPHLVRSGPVVEGQETTLWSLDGLLDNTRYVLRVKASDGMADSPWSPLVGIFVNTLNDAPTRPVLNNPSDGSGVNSATPTLSVRNASDLDGDALSYTFEVYADAALAELVARSEAVTETAQITAWTLPTSLTENGIYFWRAQASDGSLSGEWMPTAAFMVNAANDAPGAPQLLAPAEGATVATLTPTLEVTNAADPDSDALTYDFEIYRGGTLVAAMIGVGQGGGTTAVSLDSVLADHKLYNWRVRAFDGDSYGPWMAMASFATQQDALPAQIKFVPESLNKRDKGQWAKVDIILPADYRVRDIDLGSIRLEGAVSIDPSAPVTWQDDHVSIRFDRSAVCAVLAAGAEVPVYVTGSVGGINFSGVDFIKVLEK